MLQFIRTCIIFHYLASGCNRTIKNNLTNITKLYKSIRSLDLYKSSMPTNPQMILNRNGGYWMYRSNFRTIYIILFHSDVWITFSLLLNLLSNWIVSTVVSKLSLPNRTPLALCLDCASWADVIRKLSFPSNLFIIAGHIITIIAINTILNY